MNLKILIATAVAAAFAVPVAAQMSPSTDKNTGATNAPDRPANTPAPVTPTPRSGSGAMTGGTGAADRPANTPKSESGAAGATAPRFESFDRNKDGYISRDEARDASWSSRFSELDKDNDGRISRSEFTALGGDKAATGTTTRPKQ